MDQEHEALLRRIAVNDEAALEAVLGTEFAARGSSGLDPKTNALVRLAGLVALPSATQSYEWAISAAFAAGANEEEVVGVVVALTPIVGLARVNRAAGDVTTALGYDTDLPSRE